MRPATGCRRRLVETNPDLAVFLKGWTNRVNALRSQALSPGFESTFTPDFGDAAYIARVPDVGEDPEYDF
jgi:hypothetical protein